MADGERDQETRHALLVVQSMIDISAERLKGLRTQCATSAELTQQEIRTLEGKLIKLFSRQLVAKSKAPEELKNVPSLEQWLQVVGLSPQVVKGICYRVWSLEALQEKSEHELRNILKERNAGEEDLRRLTRALHNLKRYTEVLLRGDKSGESGELDLFWDSWDREHLSGASTSPRPPRTRLGRCSVPSEDCLPFNSLAGSSTTLATASSVGSINSLPQLSGTHSSGTHLYGTPIHLAPSSPPVQGTYTPPSTPPIFKTKGGDRNKFPTTPPPRKKHQTQPSPQEQLEHDLAHIISENQQGFLPKSRSHESQLGGDGVPLGPGCSGPGGGPRPARRARLPTEPGPNCNSDFGPTSPLLSSPIKSPPYNSTGSDGDDVIRPNLQVPKSPHSAVMGHQINHRFAKAYAMITVCDFCERQMFIGTGLKCKECKFKCHRDCEPKVPPSCGLPKEFISTFRRALNTDGSKQSPGSGRPSPSHVPSNLRRKDRKRSHPQPPISIAPYPGPDSSSNTSSCNSSTPSSPALVGTFQPGSQPHVSSATATTKQQQFHFPDVVPSGGSSRSGSSRGVTLEPHPLTAPPALEELMDSRKSEGHSLDSDKTVSVSGSGSVSTDSERTPVRVDSQDSQVSDGEAVDGRGWPRQNSLSMREWDIPYDELKINDRIGTGHFGTVHRGNWHGDVAIKMLNMSYPDDEKTLEAFKTEVATFRKTRHENLMLFMGACMKPPKLAIVTSLCKGLTLYTHIHLRKDKFNMNRTTGIAQQICQGMGYLHARGIVHKDLKSKNIFLENGKVVITDFGLFSVTKLCFGNRKGDGLSIPPGWLCYLAPEVIRSLKGRQKHDDEELPFTKASDVYAFGTVWYELLCGEWPFKAQPPESIIWQVGKGMKQSLANLQASQDVKNILMMCWSYRAADRPDFARLLKTLEKVPRRRLARSPSHPIHLSRSAESVF